MPAGLTRDIRLDIDPSVERQVNIVETMDIEVSNGGEEEERLLREDWPPIAVYDLRTVTGPDLSGCPMEKLQVINSPPVPCSDTAAGKDELTRTRSPVRFPTPRAQSLVRHPDTRRGQQRLGCQERVLNGQHPNLHSPGHLIKNP